jgi:hypothetical protein
MRLLVPAFAGAVAGCAQPALPPPDAMDGYYENAECPAFTIEQGTLRFADGAVVGKVVQGKSGFVIEAERAVRYEKGADGCRLLIADPAALYPAERKNIASPVIMIKLFSADRSQSMYWTRTRP